MEVQQAHGIPALINNVQKMRTRVCACERVQEYVVDGLALMLFFVSCQANKVCFSAHAHAFQWREIRDIRASVQHTANRQRGLEEKPGAPFRRR